MNPPGASSPASSPAVGHDGSGPRRVASAAVGSHPALCAGPPSPLPWHTCPSSVSQGPAHMPPTGGLPGPPGLEKVLVAEASRTLDRPFPFLLSTQPDAASPEDLSPDRGWQGGSGFPQTWPPNTSLLLPSLLADRRAEGPKGGWSPRVGRTAGWEELPGGQNQKTGRTGVPQ